MLTGQRPCFWDLEFIYKALDVRVNTSRKVYSWLRENCLALPGITTLQRWMANFAMPSNSTETSQSN